MAMKKEAIIEWLRRLPNNQEVFIDDGGLTLVAMMSKKHREYLEVGGFRSKCKNIAHGHPACPNPICDECGEKI